MVEVDIPSQTALVNDEINSLQTNKNKSDRLEYYSAQKEVLMTYVKHTLFILYYIVFIMMGLTLLAKRQEFGLMFVVIILVFFGVFPFFVDYVATYAYYRWLDIMHYFYAGNTAYLYQPDKDRVDKIKTPETSSFSTCTGKTCCLIGTTYDGKKCVPDGCVGSTCCPTGTTYNENHKICVPNVVPLGTPNADNTWKPFIKDDKTLEWRNPATPSGCGGLGIYNSITLACCPTGTTYNENHKICVPNVVPLGTPNADNTWKPFIKDDKTLEWRNPATATPSGCGGLGNYNSITLACCPTGTTYDDPSRTCK